jgi:antitoxin ParD1/3/4
MNKKLESLMDRVPNWPEEAQEEALRALAAIEESHAGDRNLSEQTREAKLAALRETVNHSIERGGSHSDEEVKASIKARLDAWERRRKGA